MIRLIIYPRIELRLFYYIVEMVCEADESCNS